MEGLHTLGLVELLHVRDDPYRRVAQRRLDKEYREIYDYKFRKMASHNEVLERMVPFTRDLCMYLRTYDLHVDTAEVLIGMVTYSCEEIFIYLSFKGPDPIGESHKCQIELLGYQGMEYPTLPRVGYPMIRYIVSPPHSNGPHRKSNPHIHGLTNLILNIRKAIGYRYCDNCLYSDPSNKFCGQGMEMYTGNCGKRLQVLPVIKS